MELIVPVTIYLLLLTYIIVSQQIALFKSRKPIFRKIAKVATWAFLGCHIWVSVPFIKNENGKSFILGWFAVLYFLVISFTVFAVVSCILRFVEKKIATDHISAKPRRL